MLALQTSTHALDSIQKRVQDEKKQSDKAAAEQVALRESLLREKEER